MQSTQKEPMYALRDIPGKGKGLVAIRDIPRGTRILSETPIITVTMGVAVVTQAEASIRRQVDALTKEQRQAFLSMHNIYPSPNASKRYTGIVRTNALPIEIDGIGGGIFLEACRINHSCKNNAQKNWNTNIKRHTVHAITDIATGEEITITYLGVLGGREARQRNLQAKLGFTCTCGLCSLSAEESKAVDIRLDEILRLDRRIGQQGLDGILSSPLEMIRDIDRQVSLYEEHGPFDVGLSRAFLDAAQVTIANSDLARGCVFAERALSGWRACEGPDGTNVRDHGYLALDPSKFELYGQTAKWKTEMDAVPDGLEPAKFEDWLWRREVAKPSASEQWADFGRRDTFPDFKRLPKELGLSHHRNSPRRHWCFLVEIVGFYEFIRLHLKVRDVAGQGDLTVAFHSEDRGRDHIQQVKVGHTVAILYAEGHVFLDSQIGVRVEDSSVVKVSWPSQSLAIPILIIVNVSDHTAVARVPSRAERPYPTILKRSQR